MDVTPLVREGQQIIQSYADGVFRVSGMSYDGPILVAPDKTTQWSVESDFEALTFENFRALADKSDDIDVLLLGVGGKMQFLSPDLKNKLNAEGLPVDIMDTGAACRTYNVLMAEGRRVVAALLPSK
jgi:uncharacterized protein